MTDIINKNMILCSGLQSGGTSIISWCFLQRPDMDGIFDMENSIIQTDFSLIRTRYTWVKMTVGSFRTTDVAAIYGDLGFIVKPLLVVRDVRYAFSSLIRKEYGKNGNTAEDPPIRMRYRRFLDDWMLFREKGWPILSFEKFVSNPEAELQTLIQSLGLNWDDSMLYWPKPAEVISYMSQGNKTFQNSRSNTRDLKEALLFKKTDENEGSIPIGELEWLEEMFEQYNSVNGYPQHLTNLTGKDTMFSYLDFDMTARKAMYDKYSSAIGKLERIRKHIIFGPLIRNWPNRDFKIF